MNETREKILISALRLFAKDGYEAVSVSQIAGELGMVKSALYKHYASKQDIFESIIARMSEMDRLRAQQFDVPEGTVSEMAEKYRQTPMEKIARYSLAQFDYWTQEEFPTLFRRMLVLEQYRNPQMSRLFHQYLGNGPLLYLRDLFASITNHQADAMLLALQFYSVMFMLYSVHDAAPEQERAVIRSQLAAHIHQFQENHPQLNNRGEENNRRISNE